MGLFKAILNNSVNTIPTHTPNMPLKAGFFPHKPTSVTWRPQKRQYVPLFCPNILNNIQNAIHEYNITV